MRRRFLAALLLAGAGLLAGCDSRTEAPDPDGMMSGDMNGLNYTPYYIHTFSVRGHDNDIRGGGSNIQPQPKRPDMIPAESGGRCCARFPVTWRPGLKVTVRWIANKKLDGIAWGSWYKAEAEVPEYGKSTYGMWVVFLPGDRVKVMVRSATAEGYPSVRARPADDDPHVAVGIVDEEANREAEARRAKERQMREAYEAELANKEKSK